MLSVGIRPPKPLRMNFVGVRGAGTPAGLLDSGDRVRPGPGDRVRGAVGAEVAACWPVPGAPPPSEEVAFEVASTCGGP